MQRSIRINNLNKRLNEKVNSNIECFNKNCFFDYDEIVSIDAEAIENPKAFFQTIKLNSYYL